MPNCRLLEGRLGGGNEGRRMGGQPCCSRCVASKGFAVPRRRATCSGRPCSCLAGNLTCHISLAPTTALAVHAHALRQTPKPRTPHRPFASPTCPPTPWAHLCAGGNQRDKAGAVAIRQPYLRVIGFQEDVLNGDTARRPTFT